MANVYQQMALTINANAKKASLDLFAKKVFYSTEKFSDIFILFQV